MTNMKISTKGRYAIKLMLDLALYSKGQPVKIKEIAKRQGISEKYLEQIVATLNKAALVKGMTLEDLVEWQQNLWTDQYVI